MKKMHTNKALIIPKFVGLSNHPSAVQCCDHTASATKKYHCESACFTLFIHSVKNIMSG